MNKFILLFLLAILLVGCYSTKNTAKVRTGFNAAYIAPKGFYAEDTLGNQITDLSSGAYFFDGSMRMGISNVIRRTDDNNQFDAKYLAEEQPDVVREFVRKLSIKAEADVKNTNAQAVEAEVELISSLTNSVQKLTNKSASLNLSRSILYRFNENVYNGADDIHIERFQVTSDSLIGLQNKEFAFRKSLITEKTKMLSELNKVISEINKMEIDSTSKKKLINRIMEIDNE
jgi:hypothetical protein